MINNPRLTPDGNHHMHCCSKKLSWTAVIAGALVATGLAFLLNLFSIAIGLSVFRVTDTGTSLALGGLIGEALGIVAAMFLGGWVAGYLGRWYCARRNLGALYGFVAWCLALLITALLAAHIGQYAIAYADFVSNPSFSFTSPEAVPTAQIVSTNALVTTEKAVHGVGMAAFTIFILFALGAFASSYGGHCGMSCKCDDADEVKAC